MLIDTDTGVDDALAVWLALHASEIEVVGITTVAGNVDVHRCTRNVRALLDRRSSSGRPRVVAGAARPLRATPLTAPEVHGIGGMGSLTPATAPRVASSAGKAAQFMAAQARRYGRDLTIVAIGPLTNVATAYRLAPASMKRVGRVISMGGAFHVPGNTGPVAEFNYYVDPHAVEVVVDRASDLLIVPLDVTEQITLSWVEVERRSRRPSHRWVRRLLKGYMDYHEQTEGFLGAYLHDPIAVAEAIHPGLLRSSSAAVAIVTREGPARGMTSMTSPVRPSHLRVARSIDADTFSRIFDRLWDAP